MLETISLRGRMVQPFGAVEIRRLRQGVAGGPSQYVSQNSDGTYTVDTSGIASALDSKSPSFGAALEAGLLNGLEVSAIATAAIGAAVIAAESGAAAAAATVAAAAAGDAAAASALAAAGATAATGVGIIAAAVILLTVLYELGQATSGPGCCGTDQSQPYGTCSQQQIAQDFQWDGQQWQLTDHPVLWATVAGSAEEFLNGVVEQTFNSLTTCWTTAPQLGPILSRAVEAWNKTHAATTTRRITRTVNLVLPYTFGGSVSFSMTQPESTEPIAVALNELAQNWTTDSNGNVVSTGAIVPVNATMGITVNDGPLLSSLPNPQNKVPSTSSSSSTAGKAVAVAGVVAAGAGGLYLYAQHQGITMGQALRRIFRR